MTDAYSENFGFIQSEVDELLCYYDIENKKDIIKRWYDGYLFGDNEVYNPWSVLNQAKTWARNGNAAPTPWWANTSSNSIIKTLIEHSDDVTKLSLEQLLNGGSVQTYLHETVTYGDLTNSNENIWSFLLFTGYLKIDKLLETGENTADGAVYSLVIPNMEIKSCYKQIIMQYFDAQKREINKDNLYKSLLSGDATGFAVPITKMLKSSISFYDNTESFYHGLVSGLLAGNTYYEMKSNRETGNGRSDLMLYQRDSSQNAIILEFKVCRENEKADEGARRALRQINDMDYAADAREQGYKNILKYGVAFKSKVCCAVFEKE